MMNMQQNIMNTTKTESLCPVCLKKIQAEKIIRDDRIYLRKTCLEHGYFEILLWRGVALYDAWAEGSKRALSGNPGWEGTVDCPNSCGLCSEHEGGTCTAVFHLTNVCNMKCPVCFADGGLFRNSSDVSLDDVRRMYEVYLERGVAPSVQLSGGEVTTRDDLPDIIRMGKNLGVQHIQVNSNGLRLAKDPDYLLKLRDAGIDLIYLQFDGVTDDVYRSLRGCDLVKIKLDVLQHCRETGIGVLLVPTIFPGVNDHQLGDIVALAKEWMPVVKGIHFQPVSYFGRSPRVTPCDEDRITLPDILKRLEVQTAGEVSLNAFVPRRRFDSHCAFSSVFFLGENDRLSPTTQRDQTVGITIIEKGQDQFTSKANSFTNKFWRMGNTGECGDRCTSLSLLTRRLKNYTLSITGMAFQDVWNIDLKRLKGCCVHVTTPQGQRIPLCAYYLTSTSGKRLYGSEQGVD
jgi:uncharacterized radical SAM superfamily Fe-S cluster-containing enzyme